MANRRFFQPWFRNLGRDGWDQPLAIPDDMTEESYNIELRQGGLGKKRSGAESISTSALSIITTERLWKYLPGNAIAAAELWILGRPSGAATAYAKLERVPDALSSAVLFSDQINLYPSIVQLNNKMFISPGGPTNATNRVLVYNPAESTTTLRYSGLAPEAAPTAANTGGGTYAAVIRSYRVVTLRIVSGVIVSQSEPSASVTFTPSGAGTAARVTKGAASGEGETHWQVQAAGSNGVYWIISSNIVVATTTFDDSTPPANYPSVGTVPPDIGSNYCFPSCNYLATDGTRLFGLGAYAAAAGASLTPVTGRLYFTPVIGSSDMGDDERIVNTIAATGYIDLNIGGGGADSGIIGPLGNAMVAFQTVGVYLLFPTRNADTPYRRVVLSDRIGNVTGRAAVMGEDDSGRPAVYFLDIQNGPYRITDSLQIEWLGKDVKDIWNTVSQYIAVYSSPRDGLLSWGVYDRVRKLVIWTLATGTNGGTTGQATTQIVFDVTNGVLIGGNEVRKGWCQWSTPYLTTTGSGNTYTNPAADAIMFPALLQTTHPPNLTLYYGFGASGTDAVGPVSVQTLFRVGSSQTKDGSTSYQAYIRSRAWRWSPLGRLKKLLEAIVVAKSQAATTIRTRYLANWSQQTLDQSVSVAAVGSSTYVRPRPNPVDFTELDTLQVEIGDSAAVDNTWDLEAFEAQLEELTENR